MSMKSVVRGLLLAICLSLPAVALAETVNINTADAATLASSMKGIGMAKAEAIVAYRTQHGPFQQVEDLLKVKGIGEKTLESIRPQLSL
jgi:competence protein ComEA